MKYKKKIVLIEVLVCECKLDSFIFDNKKISKWKSTGTFNYSDYYSMKGIEDTKKSCQGQKMMKKCMFIYKVLIFNKLM